LGKGKSRGLYQNTPDGKTFVRKERKSGKLKKVLPSKGGWATTGKK